MINEVMKDRDHANGHHVEVEWLAEGMRVVDW